MPEIEHYVGTGPNQDIPGDPHMVHGLITKDGTAYVGVGNGPATGEDREVGTPYDGFIVKVNRCSNRNQYENPLGQFLDMKSDNCYGGYAWATRLGPSNLHTDSIGVSEGHDGTYYIAVGFIKDANKDFARMMWKLDAATGNIVWAMRMPKNDPQLSKYCGYESVNVLKDGSVAVGGFLFSENAGEIPYGDGGPNFKSANQVEGGSPFMEKISASTIAKTSQAQIDSLDLTSSQVIKWRYIHNVESGQECGTVEGSLKMFRVYEDNNGKEQIVGVAGIGGDVLRIDASNGNLIEFKCHGDSLGNGVTVTCPDIEPIITESGEFNGYALIGHEGITHTGPGGGLKPGMSQDALGGTLYIFDKNHVRQHYTYFHNFGGGQYQYAGTPKPPSVYVRTECWGLAKTYDSNGVHNGFAAGCGQGIEGDACTDNLTPEAKQACLNDVRGAWRSLTWRSDLNANVLWYRMDNFAGPENNGVVGTSASEYVLTHGTDVVSISDEGFGFAFVSYKDTVTGSSDNGGVTTTTLNPNCFTTTHTTESTTTERSSNIFLNIF